MRWLQPYPDSLLDELPADGADGPESKALARETIELAYVVAVQHLAPRPRAALILRDVMGWPAKEVAALLGDSVNSVNSALQRARAGMREHLPHERQEWTGDDGDVENRDLVRRFTDASVSADIDTVATMLRHDVRYSMPPWEGLVVGRDAVVADWTANGFPEMTGLRAVPTAVNRQPAVAYYLVERGAGGAPPAHDRRAARLRRPGHRGHHLRRRTVRLAGPARAPAGRGRRAMSRGRRLAVTGLGAAMAAAALNAVVAALARAAGVDLEVTGGESIPVTGIAFVTVVFSVLGVLIAAALSRWSDSPVQWWLRTTVVLTAVSLVPPFLAAADAATAATLVALHLLAAAVVVPVVARTLHAPA